MKYPYSANQFARLKSLEERYRSVQKGICMPSIFPPGTDPLGKCAGPIGFRHAISETHLRLIASEDNKI